ncbi:MAG: DNA-3-methyladenine glycosylase 2 family protein [Dehalococcoidia bacterium]|nr:DNA-3-methyladenine glycosylase 2 family protein [Dehalococcoidia bacterium]
MASLDTGTAIAHLQRADATMARIIEMVGPFAMAPDPPGEFRSLARAIIFQQISGAAAGAIYGRFLALFPELEAVEEHGPRRTHPAWDGARQPFPEPEAVLARSEDELRSAGLSRQKTASLRDLALHFAEGRLSTHLLGDWDDEAVISHLCQVRGIGRWTAEMFLIFHMQRPNVLPVNDVGINRAIMRQYGLTGMPGADEVRRIGEPWRPWATVACWYLWRSEAVVLLTDD